MDWRLACLIGPTTLPYKSNMAHKYIASIKYQANKFRGFKSIYTPRIESW